MLSEGATRSHGNQGQQWQDGGRREEWEAELDGEGGRVGIETGRLRYN